MFLSTQVMDRAMKGKSPWVHRRDLNARFGVISRHAQSPDEIRWFETDPCAVFHFPNGWEEGSTITIVGCRSNTIVLSKQEQKSVKKSDLEFKMCVWTLDLETGVATVRQISDHLCEFPQIDASLLGKKTRYIYAQGLHFVSRMEFPSIFFYPCV
jgi:carotenoid cleavage dioxygenase-like enzyme